MLSPDVTDIIKGGSIASTKTEVAILGGQSLFVNALRAVAERNSRPDLLQDYERYFRMYDVISAEGSSSVLILARMYDPELAAELANEVATQYNQVRAQTTRQSLVSATNYLEAQVKAAETEVGAARQRLRDFKSQNSFADLTLAVRENSEQRSLMQQKVDEATAQGVAIRAEIAKLETEVRSFRAQSTQTTQSNAVLEQLRTRQADLRARLAEAQTRWLADAPEVREIRSNLESVERQIRDEQRRGPTMALKTQAADPNFLQLQQVLSQKRAEEARLGRLINSYRADLARLEERASTLPERERLVGQLEQDLQIRQNSYATLRTQLEQIRNRTEAQPAPGQILYASQPDREPVAPDPVRFGFVGFLGGLALGLVFTFLLEALRLRAYSSQQLAEMTGIPVSATIPRLAPSNARRALMAVNSAEGNVLESIRYLGFAATAANGNRARSVLFTGNAPKVGTSTAASQFALAIARTGLRVLLVDANVRSATLSRLFKAEGKSGLGDMLSREALPTSDKSLFIPTDHPNLLLLPAGQVPSGIKEAQTAHLHGLIEHLAADFDMVVFDSPACNTTADAARLAPFVDEVYLVVSARSANAKNVSQADNLLRRCGAKQVSLVMNQANQGDEAFSIQSDYVLSTVD